MIGRKRSKLLAQGGSYRENIRRDWGKADPGNPAGDEFPKGQGPGMNVVDTAPRALV